MSIDLSLSRLSKLLPYVSYTRRTIHIAGTNGKGSVSALLNSILLCANPPYRVGRFNSPHLVSVLDCILLDNQPVSLDIYDEARKEVEAADIEHDTRLTNFELLTLTAFRIFDKNAVDIAIVEVGMGGRLDATNVIPDGCILVSALTAVDLDHQAFLGSTVEEIAKEKAGIARKGRGFILGRQKFEDVRNVVRRFVSDVGGKVVDAVDVGEDPDGENKWSLLNLCDNSEGISPPSQRVRFCLPSFRSIIHAYLPLHGTHQLDNLGTALGVVDTLLSISENDPVARGLQLRQRITLMSITEGIKNVVWAGRLSFHRLSLPKGSSNQELVVLADGAHNAASASTLGIYIQHLLDLTRQTSSTTPSLSINTEIPITYILSLSHSPPKTPSQILTPLFSALSSLPTAVRPKIRVALLTFTPPEGMPWVKPVPPRVVFDTILELLPGINVSDDVWLENNSTGNQQSHLGEVFEWSAKFHSGGKGLIVLAGSLYLVADFYRFIRDVDGKHK